MEKKLYGLIKKYENDEKVFNKLKNHIIIQLPKLLEIYEKQENRKKKLEIEMEKYINYFLNNNETQYFYISTTNSFIHYKNKEHFIITSEDDIWHKILTDISSKKTLLEWKYKVKNKLICLIKKRNILNAIPESHTIQYILNHITPTFLQTRDEAKYFLTVLGDNILKKNTQLIHYINIKSKLFIDFFSNLCQFHFNKNLHAINTFKYKYYDHDYNNCRIIDFNESIKIKNYWGNFLKENIFDIIIVSCHYSKRFGDSENFVHNCLCDEDIKIKIIYLINKNKKQIIDIFLKTFICQSDKLNIKWNDMYFLWKEYNNINKFPILLFKDDFKKELKQVLNYDPTLDCFLNVSSKYLKYVQKFCTFWDSLIETDEGNEYEINELCQLYKDYLKNGFSDSKSLSEKKMKSLLEHFYPSILIKNNKYVLNICCIMWNKKRDVQNFINELKKKNKKIAFSEIYKNYCDYSKKNILPYTISKKYFEKIIQSTISNNEFINIF